MKITRSPLLFTIKEDKGKRAVEILSRLFSSARQWDDKVSFRVRLAKGHQMRGISVEPGEVGIFIDIVAKKKIVTAITFDSILSFVAKALIQDKIENEQAK